MTYLTIVLSYFYIQDLLCQIITASITLLFVCERKTPIGASVGVVKEECFTVLQKISTKSGKFIFIML
jgi:hypothetical protein